jgi:hypothetical protein
VLVAGADEWYDPGFGRAREHRRDALVVAVHDAGLHDRADETGSPVSKIFTPVVIQ